MGREERMNRQAQLFGWARIRLLCNLLFLADRWPGELGRIARRAVLIIHRPREILRVAIARVEIATEASTGLLLFPRTPSLVVNRNDRIRNRRAAD